MAAKDIITICSLHWGFIPGGVAAYAHIVEGVIRLSPIRIKSICINASEWSIDSANLKSLDVELIEIKGRYDPSWIWKVHNTLVSINPDLIMTHGFNGAFVAAISSFGLQIPIVSSWHGDYYPSSMIQRFRKPIFDFILKIMFLYTIKEIVTVSKFSKNTLLLKGISNRKIAVIHNGIPSITANFDSRSQIRRSLYISDQTILIGTACRMVSSKGIDWFLRSIAIIVQAVQGSRFVIWGDGPERKSLQSLATKLGIADYVYFPGYRTDIEKCLTALDIFVMSSFAENFSVALIEAMRAGLAIVATNVGGNPEAIRNGEDGILIPYADPIALAEGILSLIENRSLRERLMSNARQRFLSEFVADKMVAETANWLMGCARKYSHVQIQ